MKALRLASTVLLILSLACAGLLIAWDAVHAFHPMRLHAHGVAVALALVGASYALVHAAGPLPLAQRVRSISLGSAFVLWGAEQFLPPGRLVVFIDSILVLVFVVDLSLSVLSRLRHRSTGCD